MAGIPNVGPGAPVDPLLHPPKEKGREQTVFDKAAAGFAAAAANASPIQVEVKQKKAAEPEPKRVAVVPDSEFSIDLDADGSDSYAEAVGEVNVGTKGIGTCIGVCAISYKNGQPYKVGAYHYEGNAKSLERFLDGLCDDSQLVHLYLLGGYENEQTEFMSVVNQYPKIKIAYKNFNPFKVDIETYHLHERFIDDEFGFNCSIGITTDLKVQISHQTNVKGKAFPNFNDCMRSHLSGCEEC